MQSGDGNARVVSVSKGVNSVNIDELLRKRMKINNDKIVLKGRKVNVGAGNRRNTNNKISVGTFKKFLKLCVQL